MQIRLFQTEDAEAIARLFHETVREINSRDYTQAQVQAWAPDDLFFRDWAELCSHRFTYVAEDAGLIVGFGELEPNGHIDCFYCHKNYQGQGVGKQIYQAIEQQAIALGLARLYAEASITAKPFFERMGFTMKQEQQVRRRGETFTNYKMEKLIG